MGPLAFQTATAFAPSGGLAAADARCATEAAMAGLPPSTYRAFLATDGASPASRFDLSKPGGWVRRDGVRVLADRMDLLLPFEFALAATNVSADDHYLDDRLVWVGAGWTGNVYDAGTAASTCDGWTTSAASVSGGAFESSATALSVNYTYQETCNQGNTATRLLCLED